MKDIPGTVFQLPGGDRLDGTPEGPGESDDSGGVPTSDDPRKGTIDTEVERSSTTPVTRSKGKSQRSTQPRVPQFPVEYIRPHPLALAMARRIIESNPSYTKVLPGDEPGSLIIR